MKGEGEGAHRVLRCARWRARQAFFVSRQGALNHHSRLHGLIGVANLDMSSGIRDRETRACLDSPLIGASASGRTRNRRIAIGAHSVEALLGSR